MQLARVIGHATATVKHPSLKGLRLLIVQPLNVAREPEWDPVIVIDTFGAAAGHAVLVDSDGERARKLVRDEKSPVRWSVIGIVDE